MKRIIVFGSLAVFMLAVQYAARNMEWVSEAGYHTLSFGFILLAGYLLSDIFNLIRLPRITAYLLAGILFGPFGLNFITRDSIDYLSFIDDLALNFIALAAGAELQFRRVSKQLKLILLLILSNAVIVFGGFVLFMPLFSTRIMNHKSTAETLIIGALCGIIAVARSPSSAIAIISETHAKGRFTDASLCVTVISDVIVIPIFAMAAFLANIALVSDSGPGSRYLVGIMSTLAVSVASGVLIGWMIHLYFRYIGQEKIFFVMALVLTVARLSQLIENYFMAGYGIGFSLEPMVICMTAGFVFRNWFKEGGTLIHTIERSSLLVYVLFFSLTGAFLDINIVRTAWRASLVIVVLRFLLLVFSSYIGARSSREPRGRSILYGLSFITQAGVSIGLAKILSQEFPGWGTNLANIIIASIIINQIVGPVLMKFALDRAGETRQQSSECRSEFRDYSDRKRR
ncbi:cation:proton antiporter [bacterium]|nr:cation:proton antiporter [candidate division CSSED10-310 bacterium]